MTIGTVADHRSREGGAIIYPVYSRRSGGLSVGVNLFPDRKLCSFDCPYCEVFPFETDIAFNPETMKAALNSAILEAKKNGITVQDICFSGNGEPSMSPFFTEAVTEAAAIRTNLVPEAKLVLITNGSGLLNPALFEFLKSASLSPANLHIWLKLDAATEAWYQYINRSGIPHKELLSRIRDFAASFAPFTVQTMLCTVNGVLPPPEEDSAWVQLVTELAVLSAPKTSRSGVEANGAAERQVNLRAVQIYGKARPAFEDPLTKAATAAVLEERATLLRQVLEKTGTTVPVKVYE